MATKTISLALDAYERLRAARLAPNESFSSVLRRARWDDTGPLKLGTAVLDYYERLRTETASPLALLDEAELNALDRRVAKGRTARADSAWG